MQLLEREEALADLVGALQDVRSGVGAMAFVSGEAGIGKTSLVRAFTAAVPPGVRVLVGGCDDLAVARPLGPFLEIGGAIPQLGRRLSEDPAGAPRSVLEELRNGDASVCVVEDVHWADEATLDVITYLARRTEGLHSLLVITFRDDELGAAHPVRRVLAAAEPGHVRVALAPLSEVAVATLAGPGVDTKALHELTGGNPFFVTESIAADAAPSATVRDAVLARLSRMGTTARAVAEVVSVVPGQAEVWLVETVAESPTAGLSECEAGGLLLVEGGHARFRHELARRVVEEGLTGARRRELNRAVLAALAERDLPPARLAHHASKADDAEALVQHSLRAGRLAAASDSHQQACEFLTLVLEHQDLLAEVERAEVLELLSTEAYHAARPETAVPAREAALALRRNLGDPLATGSTLRWLSRLRWWSGDRAGADAAGDEAVAILETLAPGRELAMALSNRSQLAMLAHEDAQAIEWAERALALATDFGDVETQVHAATNLGSAVARDDWERGRTLLEEAADRAIDAGLAEHACRALGNAAWTARTIGEVTYARATAVRALAYAERHEQSSFAEYLTATMALIDLSSGDWDTAVAAAASLPEHGNQMTRVPTLEVLGLVAVRRGDPDGAAYLDRAWHMALESQELQRIGPIARARAEAAWLAGDRDGIDEATRYAYAMAQHVGYPWDVGELAVWRSRAGCLDDAPEECPSGFALELVGEHRAASEVWHGLGMPYARALALAGADDADSLLTAVAILDDLGATATAAVVRGRLRAAGVRKIPRGARAATRRNPAGLTPRQAEILGLVAQGLTNPQIATRLVLSAKTVEHHVAAILDKLAVSTRSDAVTEARRLGVELTADDGFARRMSGRSLGERPEMPPGES